jgi:hypothetical protein
VQPRHIWRADQEQAEEARPYCACRIAHCRQAAVAALMVSAAVELREQPLLGQRELADIV